jgi:hypothetical protein
MIFLTLKLMEEYTIICNNDIKEKTLWLKKIIFNFLTHVEIFKIDILCFHIWNQN